MDFDSSIFWACFDCCDFTLTRHGGWSLDLVIGGLL